jgi:hypothetical protein
MANFVNTNVYFAELSDAGAEVVRTIFSRVRESTSDRLFADIFVDGQDGSPSYEDTETTEFTCSHVGPRWCHLEDFEETSFRTVSAWSWPQSGLEWLFEKVGEVDPNFIGIVSFEDESPLFIGATVYTINGLYDYYEVEYEELEEIMKSRLDNFADYWEEEDDCFNVDGYEYMYELISELQSAFIEDCLIDIRDARAETDSIE